MSFGYSQFQTSTLQIGTEDIKGYRMQETDQDIMNHSVLKSIDLNDNFSSLLNENGLHPLHSWMNSIYDEAAIKQHQ